MARITVPTDWLDIDHQICYYDRQIIQPPETSSAGLSEAVHLQSAGPLDIEIRCELLSRGVEGPALGSPGNLLRRTQGLVVAHTALVSKRAFDP